MMNAAKHAALCETLETIVDAHSVRQVLQALAEVCAAKEEHIRCNWQDDVTSREWNKTARKIDALSIKTAI
jgi:hypothetical protein